MRTRARLPLALPGFHDRGIMVVGIHRPSGELRIPPSPGDVIHAGDCLIVLGKVAAVQELLRVEAGSPSGLTESE